MERNMHMCPSLGSLMSNLFSFFFRTSNLFSCESKKLSVYMDLKRKIPRSAFDAPGCRVTSSVANGATKTYVLQDGEVEQSDKMVTKTSPKKKGDKQFYSKRCSGMKNNHDS